MMKKLFLFFIAISASAISLTAQTTTVNINPAVGPFDSTIVIQAGSTDSFHMGNHPGFGAYSNSEIYICDNATLKYSYSMGTSSNPIFYLGNNARLESYGSFNAAKVYMKANSSIECFGGNFTAEQLRRVAPNTLISTGSLFFDSTFTQINFTFNGWPNNQNPCNAASGNSDVAQHSNNIGFYPNPVLDRLYLSNLPELKGVIHCQVYDIVGRMVSSQIITEGSNLQVDCHSLKTGNYHLSVLHKGIVLQNIVFTKL